MNTLSFEQLNDVFEELLNREGIDDLFTAIMRANNRGTLADLLKALGYDDILFNLGFEGRRTNKKVVVVGASTVKEQKLKSMVKSMCPADHGYEFEYKLTYHLKNYDFEKMRANSSYYAVLFGPSPHSTPGKEEYSSIIARMESNPDSWPHVIRITEHSNKLKITNNSFKRALNALLALEEIS